VGNDNNTVQILTHPDLDKEGIVTRFSAPVSALATTKDSNLIVSGAWYVIYIKFNICNIIIKQIINVLIIL